MRSSILNQKLYIIDPDPYIAGKYFSTITPNIEYYQRYFSGDELKEIIDR
jgi:hypothetical protein